MPHLGKRTSFLGLLALVGIWMLEGDVSRKVACWAAMSEVGQVSRHGEEGMLLWLAEWKGATVVRAWPACVTEATKGPAYDTIIVHS